MRLSAARPFLGEKGLLQWTAAEALRLLPSGWAMILAATIYRTRILLKGRRRIEMIPMEWSRNLVFGSDSSRYLP